MWFAWSDFDKDFTKKNHFLKKKEGNILSIISLKERIAVNGEVSKTSWMYLKLGNTRSRNISKSELRVS
jgi:hypothetical protein